MVLKELGEVKQGAEGHVLTARAHYRELDSFANQSVSQWPQQQQQQRRTILDTAEALAKAAVFLESKIDVLERQVLILLQGAQVVVF